MQRRLDVALRALRVLRDEPGAPADAAQERVLLGRVAGTTGRRFSVNVLDGEAEFLAGLLASLHQAGAFSTAEGAAGPGPLPPFVAALKAVASQVARARAAADLAEAPRPAKKRRPGEEEEEGGRRRRG